MRTRVFISYRGQQEPEILSLVPGRFRRFGNFPVVAGDIEDGFLDALLSQDEIFVYEAKDEIYLHMLLFLERLVEATKQSTVQNLSVASPPRPFNPREPMNVATEALARQGHAIVLSAGNAGPKAGTMSSWARSPWVIGVGSCDDAGVHLLAESSIGEVGDPTSGPTVVAPGRANVRLLREDRSRHATTVALLLLGKDGSQLQGQEYEKYEGSGTSFSAPRVARICNLLKEILSLIVRVGYILSALVRSAPSEESAMRLMVARPELVVAMLPFPQVREERAIAPILRLCAELHLRRRLMGGIPMSLEGRIPELVSWLKTMLARIARPLPGYSAHEVGAGYVDEELARDYVLRFSGRDFLELLFGAAPGLGDYWAGVDASLIPTDLLECVEADIASRKLISISLLDPPPAKLLPE